MASSPAWPPTVALMPPPQPLATRGPATEGPASEGPASEGLPTATTTRRTSGSAFKMARLELLVH